MSENPAVLQAIRDRYTAVDAATERKDIAGVFAFCIPNFMDVEKNATRSVEECRRHAECLLQGANWIKAETTIKNIVLERDQAIVITDEEWKLNLKRSPYPWFWWVAKLVIVMKTGRRSIWIQRVDGWFWKSSEALSSRLEIRRNHPAT